MKKDIMIVDDDPDVLESIKTLFESEGYHVIALKNGMECIDNLEKGFEGIIFMDIMMPIMDGWDTIREIVDLGLIDNIDIFVITAIGTSDHNKIRGLEPYIHDYIAKPFNPLEILKKVKRLG